MAERNPPSWIQGASHPAEHDRLALAGLAEMLGQQEGPVSDGLKPGSPGGMVTSVALGHAFIKGDSNAHQGTYHVYNDGTVNLTHDPSSSSQRRYDIVVAEILDQNYIGGANMTWRLRIVKGDFTSGSTPVEPAVPASAIPVARRRIEPLANSLNDSTLLDRRVKVNTPPSAMIYRASPFPVPNNVDTPVFFTLDQWDTNGFFNVTLNPTKLKIPNGLDGLYLVGCQMQWTAGGIGTNRSMRVRQNGAFDILYDRNTDAADAITLQGTTIARLKTNDYVEMFVVHNSGLANLDIQPVDRYSPFLWLARLGA